MSSTQLAPAFRQQFFGTNGLPLAGGQVFTYVAGTTTPLVTYTDQSGSTPNTNPIILDASGTASIWVTGSSYKFVLEDSLNNVIQTVDNIQSTLSRDVNGNFSANNFIEGYLTTVTAASTTTLTVASARLQYFTGATTQIVLLPVASTLVLGQSFIISNLSSGVVTVQSSGANTLQAMAGSSQLIATCILASGTGTASWSWSYNSFLTNIAANTILGNNTGGALPPVQLTGTQTTAMLTAMVGDSGAGGTKGLVPAPGAGDAAGGKFLGAGGTFSIPSGPTGSYAQAFFDTVSQWHTTSSTFADFINDVAPTFTVRQHAGITLTAAGSSLPGITFTPASASAVYLITATCAVNYSGANGNQQAIQITDGSTVICGTVAVISNGNGYVMPISGVYVPGTASAVTVKIQGRCNGGSTTIGGYSSGYGASVEWAVVRIV